MSKRYGSADRRFLDYISPILVGRRKGCWLWTGPRHGEYGCLKIGKKRVMAHRYSYERANGPLKHEEIVRHKCDMPLCVNPEHLETGTHEDNVRDMDERGRRSMGENHCSVLTENDVVEILMSGATHRELGEQYGVSHNVIGRIKRGEDWKHLTAR